MSYTWYMKRNCLEYDATRTLNITIVFYFDEFTTLHLQWEWHCSISCLGILPNYQYACLFLLQDIVSIFVIVVHSKGYDKKIIIMLIEKVWTGLIFLTTKSLLLILFIYLTNDNLCIIVSSFPQKNNIWNLRLSAVHEREHSCKALPENF